MLFSREPVLDDLSLSLWHFLKDTITRLNHGHFEGIEIEAKFGLILDKNTNERIHLPVHSECIVNVDGWTRFTSDMPVQYHRQFNERFNSEFSKKDRNWSYKHTKTVDRKFPSGVRLTIDPATGNPLAALRKRTLAHLHVHQPCCPVDLRFSVNVEESVSLAGLNSQSSFITERRKDRVSYLVAEGSLSVDLTQVAQYDSGVRGSSGAQVKHELEIEVKSEDLGQFLRDVRGSHVLLSSCRELSRML